MKFYRVDFRTVDDGSIGILWFTNREDIKRESRKFFKDYGGNAERVTIDCFELPRRGRYEILAFLNAHASHPDNG